MLDREVHHKSSVDFPEIYAHALKALIEQFPLFRMKGTEIMLHERAEMTTHFAVQFCKWGNRKLFDGMSHEQAFNFLKFIVSRDVDRKFVKDVVRRHADNLLSMAMKSKKNRL